MSSWQKGAAVQGAAAAARCALGIPAPHTTVQAFLRFCFAPPSCDSKRRACYRRAGARQDGYRLPTRMETPMEPGKEEPAQGAQTLLWEALEYRNRLDMEQRSHAGTWIPGCHCSQD